MLAEPWPTGFLWRWTTARLGALPDIRCSVSGIYELPQPELSGLDLGPELLTGARHSAVLPPFTADHFLEVVPRETGDNVRLGNVASPEPDRPVWPSVVVPKSLATREPLECFELVATQGFARDPLGTPARGLV